MDFDGIEFHPVFLETWQELDVKKVEHSDDDLHFTDFFR